LAKVGGYDLGARLDELLLGCGKCQRSSFPRSRRLALCLGERDERFGLLNWAPWSAKGLSAQLLAQL
jgi:hypothetical protein